MAEELTIDELAATAAVPSRTIREYQTLGLLPPPEKRGRTGVYRTGHLRRLQLIADLQQRGYSLAGIRDLLDAWSDGADLTDVLGLAPDDLVHLDEPGTAATLTQLEAAIPALIPRHLDDAIAAGLIDTCEPDQYCIPSPSLMQLAVDMLAAGYSASRVLELLKTINDATTRIADTAARLLSSPPKTITKTQLDSLASRGRGLLAHGTGRSTIYNLGRVLTDDAPGRKTSRRA